MVVDFDAANVDPDASKAAAVAAVNSAVFIYSPFICD